VWAFSADIATAVLPVPRLDVRVGVCRSISVPSPSVPLSLYPQQDTKPLSRMTQVCCPHVAIATAVLPGPRLDVWVGVVL
jgi:hypothetical protein